MATIKDLKRMCKFYQAKCSACPLWGKCCAHEIPDNADEIIDRWVEDHPARTYKQDLFEKFPNADRRDTGEPQICLKQLYADSGIKCTNNCMECWNNEIPDRG